MNIIFKILSAFLLLGLLITGCKQKRDYKAEAEKLHKKRPASPPIKSIKTYNFQSDSLNRNSKEELAQVEDYNAKGLKTKVTHYTDSNQVDYITDYSYDDRGNAIKTHSVFPLAKYESTEVNTYDKDKHLVKTEWSRTDGSAGVHEYKYDKQGKMERWDWFEKGQFVISRLYPFIYDDEGRPVESFYKETKNNRDTAVQGHEKYTYDSITGLESGKFVLYGDIPLEIVENQYDKNRNKILEIHYERDSTGKLSPNTRVMNVFNEYGEVTESNVYKDKKLQSTVDNTYDDYGHLIEAVTKEGNTSKIVRYQYEFYK
jgi:YD repeat-containing protein